MSGYAIAFVTCIRCGSPFGCNPNLVPSIRLSSEGPKEPVCEPCVTALNAVRVEQGMEPWPEPLPGAYDACPEEEL